MKLVAYDGKRSKFFVGDLDPFGVSVFIDTRLDAQPFATQGLQVTTPDVEAFRKAVQGAYASSDMARAWPRGLLDRINAGLAAIRADGSYNVIYKKWFKADYQPQ